jgi:hypothetical protein
MPAITRRLRHCEHSIAVTSTPEEMTQHLTREIAVWRDVVARAKITIQ